MNYKRIFIPNSFIFITVVTSNRENILIDNIQYFRKAFEITKTKYEFEIIAIIVNKDHFHMIIKPQDVNIYPKIIGYIKSTFTKISKFNHSLNTKRESNIWQRRYWEHTITNEEDLNKHLDYIHYNSMKHYNIAPEDWKYSSFERFVNKGFYDLDWCNFNDENKIKELNYE